MAHRRSIHAAVVAVLGALGLSATCEGQDFLAPTQLTLEQAPPFDPQVIELKQPYRGLNAVDYTVTNTGDAPARYGLFAASFCWRTEACSEKVATRVVGPVAPDAVARGRLEEDELGLGDRLHVEFHCFSDEGTGGDPCSGVLDMVVKLSVVECVASSDCASSQVCDRNLGICRVQGETSSGCQVGGGDSSSTGWALLAAGVGLAAAALGARRPGRRA